MINYDLIGRILLHPTAAAILEALGDEAKSPSGLAQELQISLGNVSYHAKVLAGGNIKGGRSPFGARPLLILDHTKPRRGALEHFYRLSKFAIAP